MKRVEVFLHDKFVPWIADDRTTIELDPDRGIVTITRDDPDHGRIVTTLNLSLVPAYTIVKD